MDQDARFRTSCINIGRAVLGRFGPLAAKTSGSPFCPFHAPGHLNRANTSDKMIIIDFQVTYRLSYLIRYPE